MFGQADTVNFIAGAAIITDNVSDTLSVEVSKNFDELTELHASKIACVPVSANALIWRIPIN